MDGHACTRRQFLFAGAAALASARLSHAGNADLTAPPQEPTERAQARLSSDADSDLASLTLKDAADRIRAKSVTPSSLVEACLRRIEIYNPKLNAFVTIMREQAMAQARQLDAEQKRGTLRSPLHGIPIALKDNIDTAGVRTSAASAVFADRVPTEDAEVTRRLKAAGAIIIGKVNLHEFAMGGTSATSYFGPVRNPWALERSPGGSSGGSAAALSAELCYGALGTDTGGSIRTPASYCSVVGLKPTYGLVSIRGIVPLVWTLDHCGPMTRTVEDGAIMLQALAGYDRLDISSEKHAIPDYSAALKQPVNGFRLGIPRAPYFDLLDEDIRKAVEDALVELTKLTKSSREVTLPSTEGVTLAGETYAYHQQHFEKSPQLYQVPTRRNLQRQADAKAAAYVQGWRQVQLLRRTVDDVFEDVDLLVMPTRRKTPRTVEAAIKREETEKMLNPELENTGQFNVFGLPAISIPCGFTKSDLPIGLQIVGPHFSEPQVLALAHTYERVTAWHTRKPPLKPDTPVPNLTLDEVR
jgi:aspartyl-tRNA(Asn)/glutamyl-tRNA(Gln) amidotransferase subunit A